MDWREGLSKIIRLAAIRFLILSSDGNGVGLAAFGSPRDQPRLLSVYSWMDITSVYLSLPFGTTKVPTVGSEIPAA